MVGNNYNTGKFSLWAAPQVLNFAFSYIGVKSTSRGIKDAFAVSPSYPNIESVVNLLDAYNCQNLLIKANLDDLTKEGYNAILYMKTKWEDRDQYYYGFLIDIDADFIEYYIAGKIIKERRLIFLEKWTSYVLLFQHKPQSIEKGWLMNRVTENFRIVLLTALLFCSSAHLYFNFSGKYVPLISLILLLSFSVTGLVLSIQLYKLEKGLTFNGSTQSKCSIYKGFDCEKVFKSKWGKILGIWSLAELGLLYFAANVIFLLTKLVVGNSSLALIPYLTISIVPAICYSILTQWLVIKNWCLKCLTIQLLLTCAALIGLVNIDEISKVEIIEIRWYSLILMAIALGWPATKKAIFKVAKYKEIQAELDTIKKDTGLFQSRFNAAPPLKSPEPTDLIMDINDWQISRLTIVISPFCEHCRDLVYEISEMANIGKLNARVFVVMNALTGPDSVSFKAWQSVSEQALLQPQNILAILKLWYECLDIEKFERHFISGESLIAVSPWLIEKHTNFCRTEALKEVPCIYFEGRRMDQLYNLKELSYFLNKIL